MLGNPAESNKSLKLELLGDWEPSEVKALEKAIKKEDPIIVFLIETKSSKEWMDKVKEECNMK